MHTRRWFSCFSEKIDTEKTTSQQVMCELTLLHLGICENVNGICKYIRLTPVFFLEVVPPPTGVALVSTGKSTARVTWNSVSKVLLYQVAVRDNDTPGNAPVIRNTSATSMDISNLEPCSFYTVGVSSNNFFLIPGEASDVTYNTASEYFNSTIHLSE